LERVNLSSPEWKPFGINSYRFRVALEEYMNLENIAAALIAATLATSAFADADHDYPESSGSTTLPPASSTSQPMSDATTPAIQPQQQGKTREQVVQELIQARREGLVPTGHTDYPPSQATIERNRARMKATAPKWANQQ
jgi:hypothetical protein